MPNTEPSFIVLILCYNEKDHIADLLQAVAQRTPHFLVVDDGSNDGTADILRDLGVPTLFQHKNGGKGQAIRTGLGWVLAQHYDYVIFMDGDGQHDPEDLPTFVAAMNEGYDFICGNRMTDTSGMPRKRRITNQMGSWALSRIINATIPDTMVGYRALKCDLLRRFPLISKGFTIETEILLRSFEYPIRFINVPVKTIYHHHGENKYQGVRDSWGIFFFCGGLEANEGQWRKQKPAAVTAQHLDKLLGTGPKLA